MLGLQGLLLTPGLRDTGDRSQGSVRSRQVYYWSSGSVTVTASWGAGGTHRNCLETFPVNTTESEPAPAGEAKGAVKHP